MASGTQLLIRGDYRAALEKLRVEAQKDKTDDFLVGAVEEIGIAQICLGLYSEAEQHFDELMEKCPYRTTGHAIYGGIARWYQGRVPEAVAIWRRALKSQYGRDHRNLDAAYMLYFAAVHRAPSVSVAEVEGEISTRRKGIDEESLDSTITQFLLGAATGEALEAEGENVVGGRNIRGRRLSNRAQVQFYRALAELRDGNRAGYETRIRACAALRGYTQIQFECVLARCEA